jgi:hypothetical protein
VSPKKALFRAALNTYYRSKLIVCATQKCTNDDAANEKGIGILPD